MYNLEIGPHFIFSVTPEMLQFLSKPAEFPCFGNKTCFPKVGMWQVLSIMLSF